MVISLNYSSLRMAVFKVWTRTHVKLLAASPLAHNRAVLAAIRAFSDSREMACIRLVRRRPLKAVTVAKWIRWPINEHHTFLGLFSSLPGKATREWLIIRLYKLRKRYIVTLATTNLFALTVRALASEWSYETQCQICLNSGLSMVSAVFVYLKATATVNEGVNDVV